MTGATVPTDVVFYGFVNRFLNRYCLWIYVESTAELYYYEGLIMKADSSLNVQYQRIFMILQKTVSDNKRLTHIQLSEFQ